MKQTDLFAAYGDDVDAALDAWPNLDPEGYAAWEASLARRAYLNAYRAWVRTQTVELERDELRQRTGQTRLFTPEPAADLSLRKIVNVDGDLFALAALAGKRGADALRRIAERDSRPAATTLARARQLEKLAAHIEAESQRLGRDVTVAEALGVAA